MTIQEKLKMFHDKRVGILVDSEEKAQELARVLDEGDFEDSEWFTWERVIGTAWDRYGDTHELYVSYNHSSIDSHSISYGIVSGSGDNLDILEVTLEELKSI
jgi:hypothetical protein